MTHRSDLDRTTIALPRAGGVEVLVSLPPGWDGRISDVEGMYIAQMPADQAGPFSDNLVVQVEPLPEGAPVDVDEIQGLAYVQAFGSVPDFQVLDDRRIVVDGAPAWFRASLQTAPGGVTAVNRQVFLLRGDRLVTLSHTSMSLRDREASAVFHAIVESFSLRGGLEGSR